MCIRDRFTLLLFLVVQIVQDGIHSLGLTADAMSSFLEAAVTKTLEYAYDDYAVALLADVLGDGRWFSPCHWHVWSR